MKKLIPAVAASAWALPLLAFAQVNNIFTAATLIRQIIDTVVIPLIFTAAFITFLLGVIKYFIGGKEEKDRKEGRSLILYSVIGFAVMIGIWGLVNVLLGTFNLNQNIPTLPSTPSPR